MILFVIFYVKPLLFYVLCVILSLLFLGNYGYFHRSSDAMRYATSFNMPLSPASINRLQSKRDLGSFFPFFFCSFVLLLGFIVIFFWMMILGEDMDEENEEPSCFEKMRTFSFMLGIFQILILLYQVRSMRIKWSFFFLSLLVCVCFFIFFKKRFTHTVSRPRISTLYMDPLLRCSTTLVPRTLPLSFTMVKFGE